MVGAEALGSGLKKNTGLRTLSLYTNHVCGVAWHARSSVAVDAVLISGGGAGSRSWPTRA